MSFVGLIVALVIEIVANVNNWVSAAILLAKSNQATDSGEKGALKAAFWFCLLEIPFILLVMLFGVRALALRGCRKRPKLILIFAVVMMFISLIIALTITFIYARRKGQAGDSDSYRDLTSAGRLLIASLILHLIAFIIFYAIIGKKIGRVGKVCRKVRQGAGRAGVRLPN